MPGTGGAATFSGSFGAGSYYAMVDADAGYCPALMSGTHTIAEVAIPAAPTVKRTAQACSGSTITAASTVTGATIVWTDNASAAATRYVTTTQTYYAYVTAQGCSGSTASVNAAPTAKSNDGSEPNSCGCKSGTASYGLCVPSGGSLKLVTITPCNFQYSSTYKIVSVRYYSTWCESHDCKGVSSLIGNCTGCNTGATTSTLIRQCTNARCTEVTDVCNASSCCFNSYKFVVY